MLYILVFFLVQASLELSVAKDNLALRVLGGCAVDHQQGLVTELQLLASALSADCSF